MLSAALGGTFYILQPRAGTTGAFFDTDSTIELINHLNAHKSAIAVFVDRFIRDISFDRHSTSHLVSRHHSHPGRSSHVKPTGNFSVDYIHPAWWSAWDRNNPHKQFLERLELLQSRRDAGHVYRTWGSEAAHRVIRNNLALLRIEKSIQDDTLLGMLERECDAVLTENNAVFVDLRNRITACQLQRLHNQCLLPIAEEPFDAEPVVQPEVTATVAGCAQQITVANISLQTETTQNTYLWSDFDSDDEELPDVSNLLPTWVQPTPTFRSVEKSPSAVPVVDLAVLEEGDTESSIAIAFSQQPPTTEEPSPDCHKGRVVEKDLETPGAGSSRLPAISEELDDDEEEQCQEQSDTTSDDSTSACSIPPRTPADLSQYLNPEPLGEPPLLLYHLSGSQVYNSRADMPEVRKDGRSKAAASLDRECVARWAHFLS